MLDHVRMEYAALISMCDHKLGLLLGMVFCGIVGSELGSRLNRRMNEKTATRAFEGAMLLVMGLSVNDFCQFLF